MEYGEEQDYAISPHVRPAAFGALLESKVESVVNEVLACQESCAVLEVGAGHGTVTVGWPRRWSGAGEAVTAPCRLAVGRTRHFMRQNPSRPTTLLALAQPASVLGCPDGSSETSSGAAGLSARSAAGRDRLPRRRCPTAERIPRSKDHAGFRNPAACPADGGGLVPVTTRSAADSDRFDAGTLWLLGCRGDRADPCAGSTVARAVRSGHTFADAVEHRGERQ